MILKWITADLIELFTRDSRVSVALWFDGNAEFSHLLPAVEESLAERDVCLLAFQPELHHGALWLKWALEAGPAKGKKAILWLPFDRGDLTSALWEIEPLDPLMEYHFSGLTWLIDGRQPTLFAFLRKHGVPLPSSRAAQDALFRGGPDSLLAKYVRANVDRDETFWKSKVLTAAVIEESIVGDVMERLLRFLADPAHEWEMLQQQGIADEFCSQVAAQYGETDSLPDDPEGWAAAFVRSLIAQEIYEATGNPTDYPLAAELPKPKHRLATRKLMAHWQRDRDHLETYRRWALNIEKKIDLRAWAEDKAGASHALRSLAAERWSKYLRGLKQVAQSGSELRSYLIENRKLAEEEVNGFWASGTDDLPGWRLALELIHLVERVDKVLGMLNPALTPPDLVEAYIKDWHQIDLAHWRLMAAARRADEMEVLAAAADRFYTQYLDAVGQAFYTAFRDAAQWPPSGCQSVSELASQLFSGSTARSAILVVDALRFDLAAALRASLGEGELTGYLANVPSETWVGMTSLLPNPDAHLEIKGGKPVLASPVAGGDLNYRAYRWKLLEAAGANHLGTDPKGNRKDEIHHLQELAEKPASLPQQLVLFDRGVDELGHGANYEVILHFEELIAALGRAIRKLKSWGYSEIHVVTDHGFVLLNANAHIQPLELSKSQFVLSAARWGITDAGQKLPVASVTFPLDPNWQVALPPGLRSFAEPGRFFHGGATLQEVVIPHLKFASMTAPRRISVTVELPKTEVFTLAVKVELTPEVSAPKDLFDTQVERLRLRVFLGEPGAPRSNEKTIEIEPGSVEPISVTLFLNREPAIAAGTEIPLQVLDQDTQYNFAHGMSIRAGRDLS